MIWTWLKSLFVKETPPAPAPRAKLRRHGEGGSGPSPHRPDPTVNRAASDPLPCATLTLRTGPWRTPDERWRVQAHWRPGTVTRVSTLDYRKGYPEVWKLEGRMRAVSRPYMLRSSMARLGYEGLVELDGPAFPGVPDYFTDGGASFDARAAGPRGEVSRGPGPGRRR